MPFVRAFRERALLAAFSFSAPVGLDRYCCLLPELAMCLLTGPEGLRLRSTGTEDQAMHHIGFRPQSTKNTLCECLKRKSPLTRGLSDQATPGLLWSLPAALLAFRPQKLGQHRPLGANLQSGKCRLPWQSYTLRTSPKNPPQAPQVPRPLISLGFSVELRSHVELASSTPLFRVRDRRGFEIARPLLPR